MKNIKDKLVKNLKIATGRLLSEKAMKKAPLGTPKHLQNPDYYCMGFPDSDSTCSYTTLIETTEPNGYVKISRSFGPSSLGSWRVWKIDTRKTYNLKGELKEKECSENCSQNWGAFIPGSKEITVYDPAGSFFGKKTIVR